MAKYENIDGLLFRDGASFVQAWNNHHGKILIEELNGQAELINIIDTERLAQAETIERLQAKLAETERLYNEALRLVQDSQVYEAMLLDGNDVPDYAGVERYVVVERSDGWFVVKDTQGGYVRTNENGTVFRHNGLWAADTYEYDDACILCAALNVPLNVAADDDTVDMEADSEGAS